MLVRVLATDIVAADFVRRYLSPSSESSETGIVTFVSPIGTKRVGIYSLPSATMFRKGHHSNSSRRASFSLYPANSKRDDLYDSRPHELAECDLYLALNQAGGYDPVHLVANLASESRLIIPLQHRRRGGGIVFGDLADTGRVVTRPDQIAGLPGNRVYQELTGYKEPIVSYGTTDAANVFEFLQVLKAAAYLGLPAVFDSYTHAHTVGDYWGRVLGPSLAMLGVEADLGKLGFTRNSDFVSMMQRSLVRSEFTRLGLTSVAGLAVELADDANFASWYRAALNRLGERILSAVGHNVSFRVINTEGILAHAPFWNLPLGAYADELERRSGHPVNAINSISHGVRTDEIAKFPKMTVARANQVGYWLGGSGIYWGIYSIGVHGGVVYTVKDSEAGEVHRLAKPYLVPPSFTHLMPVGLFRLHAAGQPEDATIDPWVFLELLGRWGADKAGAEIRKVWDAMEVPLMPEHIGTKTVATVTLDGITITKK